MTALTLIIALELAAQHTEAAFFRALSCEESGHDDNAVGDGGASRGRYQIGRAYWSDAQDRMGVRYNYDENVKNPKVCRQIMRAYWKRYKARTWEQKARMHNGGPQGHMKPVTLGYWRRVKNIFEVEEK